MGGALVKFAKQLARVAPQPVNALNRALERVMAQTLVRKLSPLECVMEKKTQGKDVVLIHVVVLIICTASCQGTATGIQEACTCRKSADNCNTVSSSDKSISCTVQTTGCVAVSSASTTVQNILTIVATFFIILYLA